MHGLMHQLRGRMEVAVLYGLHAHGTPQAQSTSEVEFVHCSSDALIVAVHPLLQLGGGLGDGLYAAGCGHTDGATGLEAFEVT